MRSIKEELAEFKVLLEQNLDEDDWIGEIQLLKQFPIYDHSKSGKGNVILRILDEFKLYYEIMTQTVIIDNGYEVKKGVGRNEQFVFSDKKVHVINHLSFKIPDGSLHDIGYRYDALDFENFVISSIPDPDPGLHKKSQPTTYSLCFIYLSLDEPSSKVIVDFIKQSVISNEWNRIKKECDRLADLFKIEAPILIDQYLSSRNIKCEVKSITSIIANAMINVPDLIDIDSKSIVECLKLSATSLSTLAKLANNSKCCTFINCLTPDDIDEAKRLSVIRGIMKK